jgi:hypothetical protein
MDDWMKNMWSMYTMECHLVFKIRHPATAHNGDELGRHYATWNWPDAERQMLDDSIYIWNLEMWKSQVQSRMVVSRNLRRQNVGHRA